MSVFDDFELNRRFDKKTEEKIKEILPSGISEILISYGCGSFLNGYLRLINPIDYQEVIKDTYFDAENAIPFMLTAFGDVITYETKMDSIGIIKYKENDFGIIAGDLHWFLLDIGEDYYQKDYFEIPLYEKAIEKYGRLKYEESFGFVPLLPLGGKKGVNHLDKVNTKVHIELITQLVGPV